MLNRAIMAIIGITLLVLGIIINHLEPSTLHTSASFAFVAIGAIILVLVWLAIRKTGGVS